MKARSIITLLLVLAVALTATAHPSSRFESLRFAQEDEPQLSSKEQKEALELVAQFDKRLRETNDFGQIVDELFVKDFPERLQQAPLNGMPWWLVDKSVVKTADPVELRRFYVTALNFYVLIEKLYAAVKQSKQESDESEDEVDFETTLSPEILAVLLKDPTLAALAAELRKDEEDNGAKEADSNQPTASVDSPQAASATAQADNDRDDDDSAEKDELAIIKSLAQLKDVCATVEKALELMRKRQASMPPIQKAAPGGDGDDEAKDEQRPRNLNLKTLDTPFYGYPKGTQVIHVDLLPFCLTLIRTDGQLKILSVHIYID